MNVHSSILLLPHSLPLLSVLPFRPQSAGGEPALLSPTLALRMIRYDPCRKVEVTSRLSGRTLVASSSIPTSVISPYSFFLQVQSRARAGQESARYAGSIWRLTEVVLAPFAHLHTALPQPTSHINFLPAIQPGT